MDYRATYSHFRILKCKLFMGRAYTGSTGSSLSYLTVGSRPFAAVQAPGNQGSGPTALVPPQLETDLRQTKWQKIRNSTHNRHGRANRLPSLYPDPDQWTGHDWRANRMWQRVWEGRRWMPFTWAQIGDARCGRRRHSLLRPICSRRHARWRRTKCNPRRDRGVHPTHDRPVPRPEISKLHRGADLGSDLPPDPLGHQAGLSGERMTTLRSPSGD